MAKYSSGPDLFSVRCDCGRFLEYTGSGYLCCPMGHGGLKAPPGHTSAVRGGDLFDLAADGQATDTGDCDHCGRDLPADVAAIGGRLCKQCGDVLARNAQAVGLAGY